MKKSFEDLITTSPVPVFVDFWADWCGPCKVIAPSVKKLAEEFSGKLAVVKVDIDEQPGVAGHYKIQGVPTLMIFRDGEIIWRTAGAMPYSQLKTEVLKALGS
ncbi:MAG: thioredoxin [Chlorobiaceae bacterium]|nr:thioredoxin [Chlorobiaceae bacterium]NTV61358.1 thioredoxin [Chlorobiaceae bacterium]